MKRPSQTRVIGYCYGVPDGKGYLVCNAFDESAVEKILKKALQSGIITQYDTGRGQMVWFNGPPGEKLRAIRNQIRALLPKTAISIIRWAQKQR